MKLSFFGKNILILGGTSDLAITLAKETIHSGLFPVLSYRTEKGLKKIEQDLKKLQGRFGSVHIHPEDLHPDEPITGLLSEHIDYMVDLYHTDYESLIASADSQNVRSYYADNVVIRHQILKDVSRKMLTKKKGRLVYLSSTAASHPNPGQGFYASSKLAIEALYKNLGIELGPKGITTATLRAGYINCGRGKLFLEHSGDALKKVPTRQALSAGEVAEALMFLLSDTAFNINATEITMDGGMTACK